MLNDLLYEKISFDELIKEYTDIFLLVKTLQYLSLNLPSSLFGDDEFSDLLEEINNIDIKTIVSNSPNTNHLDEDVNQ